MLSKRSSGKKARKAVSMPHNLKSNPVYMIRNFVHLLLRAQASIPHPRAIFISCQDKNSDFMALYISTGSSGGFERGSTRARDQGSRSILGVYCIRGPRIKVKTFLERNNHFGVYFFRKFQDISVRNNFVPKQDPLGFKPPTTGSLKAPIYSII